LIHLSISISSHLFSQKPTVYFFPFTPWHSETDPNGAEIHTISRSSSVLTYRAISKTQQTCKSYYTSPALHPLPVTLLLGKLGMQNTFDELVFE
jgi:hypothetical protein